MPLFRSTVWICTIGSDDYSERRIVEERATSIELFKQSIRNDFLAEDVERNQIQFGPVSKVDEEVRERRRKGIKRGFSS